MQEGKRDAQLRIIYEIGDIAVNLQARLYFDFSEKRSSRIIFVFTS